MRIAPVRTVAAPTTAGLPQPRATTTMLFVLGLIGLATVWIAPTAPFLDWLPLVAGVGLLYDATGALNMADLHGRLVGRGGETAILIDGAAWIVTATNPG